MKVLTPTGFKNANLLNIGDEVIAYDIVTGERFNNKIEEINIWTSENNDYENQGDFTFYLINNSVLLYKNQSIWANGNVKHVHQLDVGDIIYNENDEEIEVVSIEEAINDIWYRLKISGDHTFITEGATLHNASRFWVGSGSSSNWNATSNTNWSATSGGSNNASVPTSSDDVTFDSSGNSSSVISATINVLSLTIASGYTATMTHNAGLTISGNVTFNTGYTIAGTSNIIISAASTITSNGVTWPNSVTFTNTNTKTLSGNWTIGGLTVSGTTTLNSNTLSITGGLSHSSAMSGTTAINLTGTGTWSGSGTLTNSVTINTAGTITLGNITYNTGTITYTAGTIVNTGSTLTLSGSTTLSTNGMTWNSITISASSTLTLNSLLSATGTLTVNTSIVSTWAGTAGFTVGTLIFSNAANNTQTFANGVTYTITTSFNASSSRTGSMILFTSDHATNKAIMTLQNGASCNVLGAFTRIDASAGRTIWTFNGTITDCLNINQFTDLKTIGSSF